MKSITKIEFVNYKAFYDTNENNTIDIPLGKSVLLYGENGSGKSSIYEGLKQFFNSADSTLDITPTRHIRVPKSRTENTGTESEVEILNEVSVKVTFTDTDESVEQKIFGIPNETVTGTLYISNANLLNSFLSYRELLRTYLMDDLKDKKEFKVKFANLLIEIILAKNKNSATQSTYSKSWNDLFIPKARYKEESLRKFRIGLEYDIHRINLILNEILNYFEPDIEVELFLNNPSIEYMHSTKKERYGKYPICEIELKVKLFGTEVENEEENHLTVLNEARLSALAISIYLAALINTPQENFLYKILFLDDIFIGLDMGNRIPLLKILTQFKKPIIEQFVDGTGKVIERLQVSNNIKQYEAKPFFSDYQIFISTYDRFWFSIAKNWFVTKTKDEWHFLELFTNKLPQLDFTTPIIYTSLNYIQKADFYFSHHDYPSCANHLRKALESRIKELLPTNLHYSEQVDNETGFTELKKLKTLSQYLEKFISYCEENGIDASELTDLKNLKDWYFNPFSHDNIGTPIFKRELEIAKKLTEKLLLFNFPIIIEAGTKLYFRFNNGAGETREYRIELKDNIRSIYTEGQILITNPKILCYEWTKNSTVEQINWPESKLFLFYNNKRNRLLQQSTPDVSISTYWDELFFVNDNLPISSRKNII